MTIYNNPPLKRIPGFYTTQVHPENEVMPLIDATNSIFEQIKQMTWDKCHGSPQQSQAPNPVFTQNALNDSAQIIAKYHYRITGQSKAYFAKSLIPFIPPESKGYLAALNYAEEHLLKLKFTQITPDRLLEIMHRINLCVCQLEYLGLVYRASEAVIYTDQMPKVKNQETFLQVDQYILNRANEAQKKLWKTTRAKVWKMTFAAEKESVSFDDKDKELLKDLMMFMPDYEKVPAMMLQFAKEFCAKVAAKEELDLLCSWTHQRLVQIHPFWDGNGRTARLFMNLVRMWVGEKPLLFDNDQNYTRAVESSNPKVFFDYLQDLKKKQIDLHSFLDECFRSLYKDLLTAGKCDELMKKALTTPVTHLVKRT